MAQNTVNTNKSKILLWAALAIGIIALGIVATGLFGTRQSATFSQQLLSQNPPSKGTCYFNNANYYHPPTKTTYSECTQNNSTNSQWEEFCDAGLTEGDPNCIVRAIESGRWQKESGTPPTRDGWCQLYDPDQVIKDISFGECIKHDNWVHFAFGGTNIYYRRGSCTVTYRGQNKKLDQVRAQRCRDHEWNLDYGLPFKNATGWCSADNRYCF